MKHSPAGQRAFRPCRRRTRLCLAGLWLTLRLSAVTASEPALQSDPVPTAANCPPQVQIVGEPGLHRSLADALTRRAIATTVVPGCPTLRAEVSQKGGLFKLVLQQDVPREERLVADVATAVALIETWLRSDISAPLLSAMLAPPMPEPEQPLSPVPEPLPPTLPRATLELAPEAGIDLKSASWFGGRFHGCLYVGRLCLGTTLRMAGDLPRFVSIETLLSRLSADLLVDAELPVTVGRFTFAPGIGVGAGMVRSEFRLNPGAPHSEEEDEGLLSGPLSITGGGLRAEARFSTAVTLYRNLLLSVMLAADGSFLDSGNLLVRLGTKRTLTVPATAWGLLRGGLGLRWSL